MGKWTPAHCAGASTARKRWVNPIVWLPQQQVNPPAPGSTLYCRAAVNFPRVSNPYRRTSVWYSSNWNSPHNFHSSWLLWVVKVGEEIGCKVPTDPHHLQINFYNQGMKDCTNRSSKIVTKLSNFELLSRRNMISHFVSLRKRPIGDRGIRVGAVRYRPGIFRREGRLQKVPDLRVNTIWLMQSWRQMEMAGFSLFADKFKRTPCLKKQYLRTGSLEWIKFLGYEGLNGALRAATRKDEGRDLGR